jgi:hypothetical protein
MRRRVVVGDVLQYAAAALGLAAIQRSPHVLASRTGRLLGRLKKAEYLVAGAQPAVDAALASARVGVCLGIMHSLSHASKARIHFRSPEEAHAYLGFNLNR